MVDKDLFLEKANQIQNCLKRIEEKTKHDPSTLNDLDVQDIFVLNLQRAVQATIDLASHIASDEKLGLCETLKDNFTLLEKAKIISPALSEKLQKMVGFRNIAIHDYSAIDLEVLKSILTSNLDDIRLFLKTLVQFYKL